MSRITKPLPGGKRPLTRPNNTKATELKRVNALPTICAIFAFVGAVMVVVAIAFNPISAPFTIVLGVGGAILGIGCAVQSLL